MSYNICKINISELDVLKKNQFPEAVN